MRDYPQVCSLAHALKHPRLRTAQARLALLSARRSSMFFIVGVHSVGMEDLPKITICTIARQSVTKTINNDMTLFL